MASSIFTSILRGGKRLMRALSKRQQVGVDREGNSYYLVQESAEQPLRRQVEYRSGGPAPETVPMLWHAWLRGYRDEPPTVSELRAEEERLMALQRKVAVLKAADEKMRMQELAERRMSGRMETEPDMTAAGMLRELEAQADEEAKWAGGGRNKRSVG